jgi:hypothetical protein
MTVTAADYDWAQEGEEPLSDGYCITLARGLSAAESDSAPHQSACNAQSGAWLTALSTW